MSEDKSYPSLGQKNLYYKNNNINTSKGILKDERTHTNSKETALLEAETQSKEMGYYDQNNTVKDLLNKKKVEEMPSFREFSDEDAPK